MSKHFTVSDGEIVLFLWPAEEGGYTITSPLDDRLVSEANSLEEAVMMGHDALSLLRECDAGEAATSNPSVARKAGPKAKARRRPRTLA